MKKEKRNVCSSVPFFAFFLLPRGNRAPGIGWKPRTRRRRLLVGGEVCRTKRVRVWMRRVWRAHGGTSRGRQCTRRQTRDVRRRARTQRSAVRLAELVSRAAAFGTLTLTIYQCAGSSNTHPCFAHASATNIIERSSQTYARLFQATALRPSDNTAKDARIFAQTLYQHPTVSLSFPHNQPTPILKTTAFSHFSMTDRQCHPASGRFSNWLWRITN